ncbi:MAG TPA: hypothetical protein VGE07_16660 [Herpetosiphonaceae bacterium]
MFRKVLLTLLAALAIFGPAIARQPDNQARPPATPEFWGMVVRDPLYEWGTNPAAPNDINRAFIDAMLDNLAAAGVRWTRFEFHASWDGSAFGALNLAQADYFVAGARSRGIKVLALLGTDLLKGPQAQVARFDGGTVSGEIPAANPDATYCAPDPIGCGVNQYMETYIVRARQIAAHYRGRIDAYELFNEQNFYFALRDETAGAPRQQDEMNPLHVARVVTKIYRILRATDQDPTPIVLGGLHPMASRESGRTDRQYLAAIYASEPFRGYKAANGRWPVDGIGYHPYPAEMARLQSDNDFLHRVGPRLDQLLGVLRADDPAAKLWITEVGTRGDPASPADLARQADFLRAIASILYARRADIATFFWFKYEDFPPASESWGVVRIPFDANGRYDVNGAVALYKPSFQAYSSLAHGMGPQVYLPLLGR